MFKKLLLSGLFVTIFVSCFSLGYNLPQNNRFSSGGYEDVVIDERHIRSFSNVYELLRRTRPNWLRHRYPNEVPTGLAMNNTVVGYATEGELSGWDLKTLSRISYVRGMDTSYRFPRHYPNGVVVLHF